MAIIIPAIDLRNGKCVRLVQGDPNRETIFNDDPIDQAKRWRDLGAEAIHIVDLDAALENDRDNLAVIEKIAAAVDVSLELGGGIRDMGRLQRALESGIDYAIIGTAAVSDPKFFKEACDTFPGQIIIGADIKNHAVAIRGWKEESEFTLEMFLQYLTGFTVFRMIYTDVHRDGMLTGPNIDGINVILAKSNLEIVVSGGISTIDDIKKIAAMNNPRIVGIISGKALYTGSLDLSEAIAALKN